MGERHVSRWRLPSERNTSAAAANDSASPASTDAHASAVSLRYLDEFVRKLQCAPRLLEHQLFPDAKEITESMGLFNAVRRYVIHDNSSTLPDPSPTTKDTLADGIVVVGDGNTPRSAALFAYRLKHWKSYSIDPAMELSTSSERASQWETIENLVVIRNKIENVRIRLRRAVVVLVHAHVTLAQALSAVECDELVGVVTMPCCNWYGKQEELFGKPPSVVYDDFSILSDHRELRVWVDPRGDNATSQSSAPLAMDQSAAVMKGCVQKEFIADYGVVVDDTAASEDGTQSGTNGSESNLNKKKTNTKKKKTEPVGATTLLKQTLEKHKGDPTTDSRSRPAQPPLATAAQLSKVVAQIETQLPNKSSVRVLVLTANDNGSTLDQKSPHALVVALLEHGYENVYTFRAKTQDRDDSTSDMFAADVVQTKLTGSDDTVSSPVVVAQLRCRTNSATTTDYSTAITAVDGSSQPFEMDCVVDYGFLFRSLRNQPKKICGAVFQDLVQLTKSFTSTSETVSLISVTPRKDWRKPEFLASEQLRLQFSSTQIAADPSVSSSSSSVLFVYACRAIADTSLVDVTATTGASSVQAQKKQHALELKEALERDFQNACDAQQYETTSLKDAKALDTTTTTTTTTFVTLRGVVQHLRRFTTGPSFFSISFAATSSFHDHLQISVDPLRLTQWTGDSELLTLDAVLRLLHKGDCVECVGEMARNAQQQPMLRLHAMRFLQSEFQAYQ